MVLDGAILLTDWYESYYGERARFPETMDYEIAVNGRGIPDYDLVELGEARVSRLLRRGVAFAWAALHEQHRQLPDIRMAARISAAPIWVDLDDPDDLMDPDGFTGYVTFYAMRSGRPLYTDLVRLTDDVVVALFTEDCGQPLPVAKR
jgi:hypothetical protein